MFVKNVMSRSLSSTSRISKSISATTVAACGSTPGELEALMKQAGADTHDPLLKFQKQSRIPTLPGRPHLCPRCDAALHEIQVEHAARAPDPSTNARAAAVSGLTPTNCSSFSQCFKKKAAQRRRSIT